MSTICLDIRTENSIGAGVARTEALLDRAREFRFTAVARADRATLLGIEHFTREARRRGLHPVAGVEFELASIVEGEPLSLDGLTAPLTFPIALYAETASGYRNLVRLVSRASTRAGAGGTGAPASAALDPHQRRGAGRPFITLADLESHHHGLIARSPGLAGEFSNRILRRQADLAERLALRLAGVFGRSAFFLGLTHHGHPLEARLCADVSTLAARLGIPVVVDNVVDHLDPDDAPLRDMRAAIEEGRAWSPRRGMGGVGPASHFRSPAELRQLFRDHPEALEQAGEIALRCRALSDEAPPARPRYPLPPGRTEAEYLASLCVARLPREAAYQARLRTELATISRLELAGWLLILWDVARYSRARGIPTGPGRGPLVSSLAAHLLGITRIDPVAGGLYFERFVSAVEEGLPGAVMEVPAERRPELLAFLEQRFGREWVARGAGVEGYTARSAIEDVGRALELSGDEIATMARRVPEGAGADAAHAVAADVRLARQYHQDERVRTWLDLARRLQGLPRRLTVHRSGVILAPGGPEDGLPVEWLADGHRVAQASWSEAAAAGLGTIDLAGPRPRWRSVARLLEEVRPETAEDLAAVFSLQHLSQRGRNVEERFLSRRRGAEEVHLPEPEVAAVLERTHGLLLEREQVIALAMGVAGFTAAEAETLRRLIERVGAGAGEMGAAGAPPGAPADSTEAGMTWAEAAAALAPWRMRFVQAAVERGFTVTRAEGIFQGLVHAGPAAADRGESLAEALAFQEHAAAPGVSGAGLAGAPDEEGRAAVSAPAPEVAIAGAAAAAIARKKSRRRAAERITGDLWNTRGTGTDGPG